MKNMMPSHTAAAMLPHPPTIPLYSTETGAQRNLTNDDLIPITRLSQPFLVKDEDEPPGFTVKDVWEYLQPAPGELDLRTEIRSMYPGDEQLFRITL